MQKSKRDKKGGKKSKSKAAAVEEVVQEPAQDGAGTGIELLDLDMGTKPSQVRVKARGLQCACIRVHQVIILHCSLLFPASRL